MTEEQSQLTEVERQVNGLISQAEADLMSIYNAANDEAKNRILMFRADLTGVLSKLNVQVTSLDSSLTISEQVNHILGIVSDYYRIDSAFIIGQSRKHEYLVPRQVAIFLIYRFVPISYVRLSTFFDNRDHTTLMNACQKIEKTRNTNADIRQAIGVLERQINAQPVARKPNPRKGKRASTEHIEKIHRGVQARKERDSRAKNS